MDITIYVLEFLAGYTLVVRLERIQFWDDIHTFLFFVGGALVGAAIAGYTGHSVLYAVLVELIASALLLANKYYMAQKVPIGWLLGAAGILTMAVAVRARDMQVSILYFLSLSIIMLYGYVVAKDYLDRFWSDRSQNYLKAFMALAAIVVCCRFFVNNSEPTPFHVGELAMSITGLLGTLFLAIEWPVLGWFLFILSHIIAVFLFNSNERWIVVASQLASLWIARVALGDAWTAFRVRLRMTYKEDC